MKVSLISLGCARTLVDSEAALGNLLEHGYQYVESVAQSDIAVVNTCGFIQEAKQESIDTILKLIKLKKQKTIQSIVVMGCLSQRYGSELKDELVEVDAFVGTNNFGDLARILEPLQQRQKAFEVQPRPRFLLNAESPRKQLTPLHYAYIKVSEGCVNACSYCAIPRMKGPHRSRSIEDILAEATKLLKNPGLREVNIIGQDVAAYGFDLEKRSLLPLLLERLATLMPNVWIRILYAHPAHVNDELIETIKKYPNICRYIDLPIEHSHDDVLLRMNRGCTRSKMDEVIKKLRKIPDIVLRTTVIVGFPGETEEEFNDLLNYLKKNKFERLGAFTYSREEGTRSFNMDKQISESIKKDRLNQVMSLQMKITSNWNEKRVGDNLKVLVEEKIDDQTYLGRSEADAPEVDGSVIITSNALLQPGSFIKVAVEDSMDHDVVGACLKS